MAMMPAMAMRCFWPPERWWGAWRTNASIPTALRAASTRFRISAVGTPKFSGPKATSSSTTLATIWLSGFWNTMPTRRRISSRSASSQVSMPSTHTLPPKGSSTAFICLARVDLPDPLWPSTATKLPRSMERDTPLRAARGVPPSSAG